MSARGQQRTSRKTTQVCSAGSTQTRSQRPRAKAHRSGRTSTRTRPSLPQDCFKSPGEYRTFSLYLAYTLPSYRVGCLDGALLESFLEDSPGEPDLGATALDHKGRLNSYMCQAPGRAPYKHILLNPPIKAPSLYYNGCSIL